MPITSITIENFKGIANPVTIPIRPITLLFVYFRQACVTHEFSSAYSHN